MDRFNVFLYNFYISAGVGVLLSRKFIAVKWKSFYSNKEYRRIITRHIVLYNILSGVCIYLFHPLYQTPNK